VKDAQLKTEAPLVKNIGILIAEQPDPNPDKGMELESGMVDVI